MVLTRLGYLWEHLDSGISDPDEESSRLETRKSVCSSCPIRFDEADDCSLRVASLGLAYTGLFVLFKMATELQKARAKQISKLIPHGKFPFPLQDPVSSAIDELKQYLKVDDSAVIESGRKGIAFYGATQHWLLKRGLSLLYGKMPPTGRDILVDGFLGALIFQPSENESSFSQQDMEFLRPRLTILVNYCDEVATVIRRKDLNALLKARRFLDTICRQMDFALRFGLSVGVSA